VYRGILASSVDLSRARSAASAAAGSPPGDEGDFERFVKGFRRANKVRFVPFVSALLVAAESVERAPPKSSGARTTRSPGTCATSTSFVFGGGGGASTTLFVTTTRGGVVLATSTVAGVFEVVVAKFVCA